MRNRHWDDQGNEEELCCKCGRGRPFPVSKNGFNTRKHWSWGNMRLCRQGAHHCRTRLVGGARPRDQRVALHTIDLRDMSLLFELPNTVHAQHHIQEGSSQSRYLQRVLLPRIMVDPGQRRGITMMGFGRTCNHRHPMVQLDAHLGP